eukprot:240454-Chlamydomonas_euryale.AAC.1
MYCTSTWQAAYACSTRSAPGARGAGGRMPPLPHAHVSSDTEAVSAAEAAIASATHGDGRAAGAAAADAEAPVLASALLRRMRSVADRGDGSVADVRRSLPDGCQFSSGAGAALTARTGPTAALVPASLPADVAAARAAPGLRGGEAGRTAGCTAGCTVGCCAGRAPVAALSLPSVVGRPLPRSCLWFCCCCCCCCC